MKPLTPEIEEAQRFLDILDKDGMFTFQTFADGEYNPNLIRVFHGTLSQHAKSLAILNRQGAGIFVMVNEGDGVIHEGDRTCRTSRNVIRVRSMFVDLDGSPLDPIRAHAIPPHIIVESSRGRWHAYWLTDGCSLAEFKPAQQRLAKQFSGDPSVCDLNRVMRLPGFFHQKSEPVITQIIYPAA